MFFVLFLLGFMLGKSRNPLVECLDSPGSVCAAAVDMNGLVNGCASVFWPDALLLKTTSRSCRGTGAGPCSGYRKRQDADIEIVTPLSKPIFSTAYICGVCLRYSTVHFSPTFTDVRALLDSSEQCVQRDVHG